MGLCSPISSYSFQWARDRYRKAFEADPNLYTHTRTHMHAHTFRKGLNQETPGNRRDSDHGTTSYITTSGTAGKRLQGHNALLCGPALRRTRGMENPTTDQKRRASVTHSSKRANKLRAVEIAVGTELVSEIQLTQNI